MAVDRLVKSDLTTTTWKDIVTKTWHPGTPFIPAYDETIYEVIFGGTIICFPGDPNATNPIDRLPLCWTIPTIPPKLVPIIVHHAAVPATPGYFTTDITVGFTTTHNLGWTGGANSITAITGDGTYTFTMDDMSVGVVTGFNTQDRGAGYQEIQFGFRFNLNHFTIMEAGVDITTPTTYLTTDTFKVVRVAGVVTYYKNSTLLYTSLVGSVGTLFVDASLYAGGDEILSAALTPAFSGGCNGTLGGLSCWSGSGLGGVVGVLPGLSCVAGNLTATANCTLSGLHGESYAGAYAVASCVLGGLQGTGGNDLAPDFNGCDGVLGALAGVGFGLTGEVGQCIGVLGGLNTYAANFSYADCHGVLTPLVGVAGQGVGNNSYVIGVLGGLQCFSSNFAYSECRGVLGGLVCATAPRVDIAGTLAGVLSGLQCFSGNTSYAMGQGILDGLRCESYGFMSFGGGANDVLPGLQCFAGNITYSMCQGILGGLQCFAVGNNSGSVNELSPQWVSNSNLKLWQIMQTPRTELHCTWGNKWRMNFAVQRQ